MSKQVLINGVWQELADMAYDGLPVGFSLPFRGKVAPYGWLVEDGSELQIATYPDLFKAIGTTYGGDGVATFKIPNSIGKYMRGGLADEVGTEVEAGLPNITGSLAFSGGSIHYPEEGALGITPYFGTAGQAVSTSVYQDYFKITVDASRSSNIYGNSDTVTPPTLVALPCIKAFDTIVETAGITTQNLAAEIAELKRLPELTEERVVAKLNGKNVYENMLTFEFGGAGNKTFDISALHIEKNFSMTGNAIRNNSSVLDLNWSIPDNSLGNQWFFTGLIDNNSILFQGQQLNNDNSWVVHVTLRYTKTTD